MLIPAAVVLTGLLVSFSGAHAAPLGLKLEKKFVLLELSEQAQLDIKTFLADVESRTVELVRNPANRKEVVAGIMKVARLGYESNFHDANTVLLDLEKKYPDEPIIMWQLSANYFFMATKLDGSDTDLKITRLRAGMKRSKECLKTMPNSAGCRLAYAALLGTLGLVEGIFDTISSMEEVSDSLHIALGLSDEKTFPMAPNGITSRHIALCAMAEFYRLVPDWWIFGVMAGVRGDKEKSWHYASQIPVENLGVANVVVRAALCFGGESEDTKLIEHGLSVLATAMQMEMLHPFDEREYSRLAKLYRGLAALEDADFDDYVDLGCYEFGNDEQDGL